MLVASMNPCPCGYHGHPSHPCTCSPGQIQRYMGKVSGPLLDRIDIQVEVAPVSVTELHATPRGESSETIRARVVKARNIQTARFESIKGVHCNAQMTAAQLNRYACLDQTASAQLEKAMKRLGLSARAYERILKVARTIADLDGSDLITATHIGEAVSYRNLDRSDWMER